MDNQPDRRTHLGNPTSVNFRLVLLSVLGTVLATGCASSDSAQPVGAQQDASLSDSGGSGGTGFEDAAKESNVDEVGADSAANDAAEAGASDADVGSPDALPDAPEDASATDSAIDGDDSGGEGFWNHAYDPQGNPAAADGHHNATQDCMTCHAGSGSAPKFLFGGTIFDALGKVAVAHAEVGIKDPGGFHWSYSGSNGNFWVLAGGDSIDWSQVEIRARDANGEMTMPVQASAGCNSCHKGPSVIKAF